METPQAPVNHTRSYATPNEAHDPTRATVLSHFPDTNATTNSYLQRDNPPVSANPNRICNATTLSQIDRENRVADTVTVAKQIRNRNSLSRASYAYRVTPVAQAAGLHPITLYRWRHQPPTLIEFLNHGK